MPRLWNLFYTLKPLIPRALQIGMRRFIVQKRLKSFQHLWPIDPDSAKPPVGWPGWPQGRQFAVVLSHDVDSQKGHDRCRQLAAVEKEFGFRSSFNFVPERYQNSVSLREELRKDGFDICIHGLKHDGKLFKSYRIFKERAARINRYMTAWQVDGFTSPSMHHNLNWMHHLNIKYSISTFDTDPFEPQPDGVGTIFPFWVINHKPDSGYIELPYTLPQDFTLYILMRERRNDIWKKKLDWIARKGGMVLLNTHPDYMNFNGSPKGPEEYPVHLYKDFLKFLKARYGGLYYNPLPGDLAAELEPYFKKTAQLNWPAVIIKPLAG